MGVQAQDLWAALDQVAAKHQLTASGLARLAGLDGTTFNKSKRQKRDSSWRWPSTHSIACVLDALNMTFLEFTGLVNTTGAVATKPVRSRKSVVAQISPDCRQ